MGFGMHMPVCFYKDPAYDPCLKAAAVDATPPDLAALLNALQMHPAGMAALLPRTYKYLESNDLLAALDASTAQWLKTVYIRAIAGELVVKQWTETVISTLTAASIPIVLLKGAAFAEHLYASEAPRPGRDIDLLVREQHFSLACELMATKFTEVVVDKGRRATHEMLFERVFRVTDGDGPTIEIHKGLTNPHIFSIAEQGLWDRSLVHPVHCNGNVRMLSPEDTLLHLAVHAFRDLDFCTHNLLDAHELMRQSPPDQLRLKEAACEWGACRVLYLLLDNSRQLLASPLAADLLNVLGPSGSLRLAACRWTLSRHLETEVRDKPARLRFFQLLSQYLFPDSLWQGARFQLSYAKLRLADIVRR